MGAILHLSDLHFGAQNAMAVEALVAFADSLRHGLDAVVLSGDVTQRARPEQFAMADAFLARLPQVPTFVTPGNHDIALFDLWQRLIRPYARYAKVFGRPRDVSESWSNPDWFLVTLNSTRRWRHKHGELSSDQIGRVSRALQHACDAQVRLLALHHPLAVPAEAEAGNRVRNRRRAASDWGASGVDAVLGGHIHWPCVVRLAAPRRCWSVLAGTGVSTRTRRGLGNSVNLLLREPAPPAAEPGPCNGVRPLVVERWDHEPDSSTGVFVRSERRELLLDRGPAPG